MGVSVDGSGSDNLRASQEAPRVTWRFPRRPGRSGIVATATTSLFAIIAVGVVLLKPQLEFQDAVALCFVAVLSLVMASFSWQYWAERRLSALDFSAVSCQFCTAEGPSGLECQHCKALNWEALRACSSKRTLLAGWLYKHGLQAGAGTISAVVAAAGSICVGAFTRDEAKRDARLETAKSALDAGNRFRGALLQVESTCNAPRSSDCQGLIKDFRENFFRYSREAPELVWCFRKNVCQDVRPVQGKRLRNLCAIADDLAKDSGVVDELNKSFRAYTNAVAQSKPADPQGTKQRRWIANVIYENGRTIQCMLNEVMYSVEYFNEEKPFGTHLKCDDEGRTCLRINDAERTPQSDDELQWQLWPSL